MLASGIQIIGRTNGGKEYVKNHNIYINNILYEKINNFIQYQLEIIRNNPLRITKDDFREKTQQEKDAPYTTIPICIDLTDDEYNLLTQRKGIKFSNKEGIKRKICENHSEQINGYIEALCHEPQYTGAKGCGYSKSIKPIINAITRKDKFMILHIDKKESKINYYSVYFDSKNKKMLILRWEGSKRIEE